MSGLIRGRTVQVGATSLIPVFRRTVVTIGTGQKAAAWLDLAPCALAARDGRGCTLYGMDGAPLPFAEWEDRFPGITVLLSEGSESGPLG